MQEETTQIITSEEHIIHSALLNRSVTVDCYLPTTITKEPISLLLVNDGQDLVTMGFEKLMSELFEQHSIQPLMVIGIHCSEDRKNEYGTAGIKDYMGRGAKADVYASFIMSELLPFIRRHYQIQSFKDKSFAGFSLGGLSALDIVWTHGHEFLNVGVFSGSLWWRNLSQDDPTFDERKNRIAHQIIKAGKHHPWLRFFFEVGAQDETADRNNNGIIDSIEDTLDIITELKTIGYKADDIKYVEIEGGEHNFSTWKNVFPEFLEWVFSTK
jgi:enterochelin esterase-like enzyme